MDVNSGVFSRKNGAYTDASKKNGRIFERAASMLIKCSYSKRSLQKKRLRSKYYGTSCNRRESSTVEEIVETHAADKKDTVEDVIVTMEDKNKYS
ncbi:hypothetical protein Tco_1239563 [Tanacetum coccineum]